MQRRRCVKLLPGPFCLILPTCNASDRHEIWLQELCPSTRSWTHCPRRLDMLGHFEGGQICRSSSNQMAQQQAFEPKDGSQAKAHICDQTTKDLPLWGLPSVPREILSTLHMIMSQHTHCINKHTHRLTDVCLSSCSALKYPTSLIRFPPLGAKDCTLTSQWPGN